MLYKEKRMLEREIKFTRIYWDNRDSNKHLKEALCMQYQLKTLFTPLRNEMTDRVAGHINPATIGIFSLRPTHFVDELGYCFDDIEFNALCEEAIHNGNFTKDEIRIIEEVADYWKEKNTNTYIRSTLPKEIKNSIGGDDFKRESAAVYPLYRLSGAHLNFAKLLKIGLVGLIKEIEDAKANVKSEDSIAFYEGMILQLETIIEICISYRNYLTDLAIETAEPRKSELNKMAEIMNSIAHNPPKNFREAVQLVYLYMAASDSKEIGRLDAYLAPFYKKDIEKGTYTREEFVDMIVDFFDMVEYELHRDTRAVIGGVGREDEATSDELALIVLDAIEKRPMANRSDRNYQILPQVCLRCYKGMNEKLVNRAIELLGKGYCFPVLYNDDVNVPNVMRAMDVPNKTAQQYCLYGSGVYGIAAKSINTPNAYINIAKLLEITLNNGVDPLTERQIGPKTGKNYDCNTFEELMKRFEKQVEYSSKIANLYQEHVYNCCAIQCDFQLVSALMDDCISRGKAILDGGISHLGCTVGTYGNITTSDSLTAIKQVVYQDKKATLADIVEAIKNDFIDHDELLGLVSEVPKFGNDNKISDDVAEMVHGIVCNKIRDGKKYTRLDSTLAVIINNKLNVIMGANTGATPDGRLAGTYLSNAIGAFNGRDTHGLSALIHSMTKLDSSIHAGGNQNFKFSPNHFTNGGRAAKALLSSFFDLGGQQCNLSVVNQEDLEEAMKNPQEHENLLVRVGGFTARFIDLDEKTQRDVLERTAY